MSACTQNRTHPVVGAVLTAKRMHKHVRGRDRSHSTRDYYLEPYPMTCRARQPANGDVSACAQNRTYPLVGAVLTVKRMHKHVRGRDRSHGTRDFYLKPYPMTCRVRQPASGDVSACTQNRTLPLVGAVLTAKRMHRHLRGRDRSHGTGNGFLEPSCP